MCIQDRKADARSHLAQAWDIDHDVPNVPEDFGSNPSKVMSWLGLSSRQISAMMQKTADDNF